MGIFYTTKAAETSHWPIYMPPKGLPKLINRNVNIQ